MNVRDLGNSMWANSLAILLVTQMHSQSAKHKKSASKLGAASYTDAG